MQQLYYPTEVRAIDDIEVGEANVKDNELRMAVQLAEMGAADEFHPENYHDEVSDRIRAVIQQKVDGQEITAMEAEQPRAQVIDLMEALKASLAAPQRKQASAAKVARLPIKPEQKRKAPKAAPRTAKVVAKARSSR
jgi:DNA end-binding protein Ku